MIVNQRSHSTQFIVLASDIGPVKCTGQFIMPHNTGSCLSQQIIFGQEVVTKSRFPRSRYQGFPPQFLFRYKNLVGNFISGHLGKVRVPQDFAGSIHIQLGPSIFSQCWSGTRRVWMRKTDNGNGHETQETEKAQEKAFGHGFNIGNGFWNNG